jgi:hypothetical protein
MKIALRALLALLVIVSAASTYASETGSVSGVVNDGTGQPVPGATVKITGSQAPRNTVTGPNGGFNFPVLLPGNYTVEAALKGLGSATQKVLVLVDNDAQLTLTLLATARAEIIVTGVSSEIDKKASEVNFNYTDTAIKDLPVGRTYEGLLKLVPGAATSSGTGYVSVSGGTRQDNKYLLDGVNVGSPGYGWLRVDTNALDISDFNVKKAGITAEFGRTSGAIFNAVTKSGSNQIFGALLFNASPSSFQSNNDFGTSQDTSTYNGQANFGFPILKDTLFGYVSAAYYSTTISGQSATVNNVTTNQPDSKSHSGDYFGKLTAFIGQPVLVNASFRAMPAKATDQFASIYDAASAAYSSESTNYVGNLTVDWFASKNTVVEGKYVYYSEAFPDFKGQTLIPPFQPQTIDPKNLGAYGTYADPARNNGNVGIYEFADNSDKFSRSEVKATLSQYFDLGPTQNQFKLGGGYEDATNDTLRETNGWGTWSTGITCPVSVCGVAKSGTVRARYYTSQPVQYSKARTYAAFIQDTITWKNLSVYLGLLANRDDFAQVCATGQVCGPTGTPPNTSDVRYNFMTFNWDQQLQPRLGIVWNANLLKGDKFYSSFGEYSGMDLKSTSRSFAPFRIRQDEAFFDGTTGVYLGSQFRGSSGGKLIPPGLNPPYYQEWVIGYSAAATRDVSFDVYYQYRNLKNAFEDVPINPDNFGGSFQAANIPWARRVYRAVTLDVQKRYADRWYADANITFSKLYGNWDADYDTGIFNTSGYLEDGPGWNSAEANRYGRLGQDRPIIAKLMGSYDFNFGLTMGAFLRVQSGAPWQAQGREPVSTTGQSRYLEPAGSQRFPTWTTFDLLAAYTFRPSDSLGIRFEARVTNLFDTQTVIAVNRLQYNDPYVNGVPARNMGPQGTSQPNPLYGTATAWATPRRFVLSARLDF